MDSVDGQFDRLPPHSMDAEMCLCSSIMLNDNRLDLIAVVRDLVSGEDFYSADHQIIFETAMAMHAAKKKVDAILLSSELESRQLLEEVGGRDYIGRVVNTMPSQFHAAEYAEVVREKSLLRKLIAATNDALREAYSPSNLGDAEEMVSRMAARCASIIAGSSRRSVHSIGDISREVAARRYSPESFKRLRTRLVEINDLIGGIPITGNTLVGGNPGMGKSALCKQLAIDLSMDGIKVGYISLEEGRHKIGENYLSSRTRIANNRIAFGTASPEEWDIIEREANATKLPFKVIDDAFTLPQVLGAADLLTFRDGCQVIFVDHLHLIDGQRGKAESREEELTKISHALKRTWLRNNVAGVVACQLNRSSGRERPTIASLRGTGTLEQDGDVILLLHREDYYRKQDAKDGQEVNLDEVLEINIAKNKSGATGIVGTRFEEQFQFITNLVPDARADPVAAQSHFDEQFPTYHEDE